MAGGNEGVSSELSRDLNLFHVTMMGMGMMIGAGVFIGIGESIHYSGPGGVMLTFALNGVIAIFTAMSYAELSSAIPRAGGAYNFARMAFGRGTSFTAGWMEWFASSVAGAMYAVTFAIYSIKFIDAMGWGADIANALSSMGLTSLATMEVGAVQKTVALVIALFFLFINYLGASETGKVGAVFTIGQMLFVIFIGIAGVFVAIRDPERLQNFKPFLADGWTPLLATMGFTYVAFEGFEVIAQAGDETIDPRRNIPKAMLYSVCLVTICYVATAFATIVAVKAGSLAPDGTVISTPWQWIGSFHEKGFGEAVAQLMPYGRLLLTLAVIFASTSALNATIYSATRASYALGRDRMLPGSFSKISQKRKTPWVALGFTGVIVISIALFLQVTDVVASASIMFLFLFLLINVCVIKIRRNMADELDYGFIMPLFPLFPILAIACQLLMAGHLAEISWKAWIVAPAWVLGGVGIYLFYSRSRALTTPDEIHVFEEEAAPAGDEYRIMVSVANPDNALQMVRHTHKLCRAKDGRVELLHMVPVPDQVPLSDAEQYMYEGRAGITEAMLYLAPRFPLSTTIRYCRNIARGIISAVREKKVHMLIMGWHGEHSHSIFNIGSTIDPVIERAPCNVVMMKNCGNQKVKRVLVPVAGGPNGALALEMAAILAEEDGEIVVFTVDRGRNGFDIDAFVSAQVEQLSLPRERISTKTVASADVVGAILGEAEAYDLIVLGSTRQPWIRNIARDPVPERIARQTDKPVIMVRAAAGLRSWISRWI